MATIRSQVQAAKRVVQQADPEPIQWDAGEVELFDGGGDIRDKAALVGQSFMIGRITFRKGDYGPYVTVTAVDPENQEFVFNDGSSGVYRQLVTYLQERGKLDKGIDRPDSQEYEVRLLVQRGLRVSEYEGPQGKPARTYYLA